MKLTFLGTGTSQGVPVIGCACEVCVSNDSRDKRLRTSAMIEVGGKRLVIDTGPDFRQQMLRENVDNVDAVLFTHEHKDHVAGLDDVRPINFKHNKHLPIYSSKQVLLALEREYHYIFDERFNYPGIPRIEANIIENKPFQVGEITIEPVLVYHYKLPVFGFKIGKLAYITDANRIDMEEKEKLKDLDVLVLNALRREEHISHFTLQEAIDLVNELNPKKAYFTHASHHLGLQKNIDSELPDNIQLAYDGLSIDLVNPE